MRELNASLITETVKRLCVEANCSIVKIPQSFLFVKRVDKIVPASYNGTQPAGRKGVLTMNNTCFPWHYPVFFRKNRVFRVYLGGKLLERYLGTEGPDGNYPEEWICSTVRAINPGHTDPLEGRSLRADDGTPFDILLAENREACFIQASCNRLVS